MDDKHEVDRTVSPVTKFRPVEAQLAVLKEKYSKIVLDVSTPKGLKDAKKIRREIVSFRTSIDKARKKLKAPLIEKGRVIESEAKRITAEILLLEEPVTSVIRAEEERIAEEKAAAERADQERIDAIKRKIETIENHAIAAQVPHVTSDQVKQSIVEVQEIVIDDSYEEFRDQAIDVKAATLSSLAMLRQTKQKAEADAEELAQLRAEKAERERKEAEEADRKKQVKESAEAQINKEPEYPEYPGFTGIVNTVAVKFDVPIPVAKAWIVKAAEEIGDE